VKNSARSEQEKPGARSKGKGRSERRLEHGLSRPIRTGLGSGGGAERASLIQLNVRGSIRAAVKLVAERITTKTRESVGRDVVPNK